ncbi:MAG: hypothetical protein Kow00127_04460 [Bacteroidales bacterium]
MRAAVAGGAWASVEIILGSFFHNLRLPFSGSFLAMFSTVLVFGFYRMWPYKGLIWRAGLIAALMKSVSPSAVILGPMIGIFSEALIIEGVLRVMGNNFLSRTIAGAFSVSMALVHKIVSLLVMYGFHFATLFVKVLDYLAGKVGIDNPDPKIFLLIVTGFYALAGLIASNFGNYLGKKATENISSSKPAPDKVNQQYTRKHKGDLPDFSLPLLFAHLIILPAGLLLLSRLPLVWQIPAVILYVGFCMIKYQRSMRRLMRFSFWIQLGLLTMIAAVFWNGFNGNGDFFDADGLIIGLEMNLRALFVVIGFSSLGTELGNPKVKQFLIHLGFHRLYEALGLSFLALPGMINALPDVKTFLRNPVSGFSAMLSGADDWLHFLLSKKEEQDNNPDYREEKSGM